MSSLVGVESFVWPVTAQVALQRAKTFFGIERRLKKRNTRLAELQVNVSQRKRAERKGESWSWDRETTKAAGHKIYFTRSNGFSAWKWVLCFLICPFRCSCSILLLLFCPREEKSETLRVLELFSLLHTSRPVELGRKSYPLSPRGGCVFHSRRFVCPLLLWRVSMQSPRREFHLPGYLQDQFCSLASWTGCFFSLALLFTHWHTDTVDGHYWPDGQCGLHAWSDWSCEWVGREKEEMEKRDLMTGTHEVGENVTMRMRLRMCFSSLAICVSLLKVSRTKGAILLSYSSSCTVEFFLSRSRVEEC